MCNLYRMNRSAAEVASLFGASAADRINIGENVYPGYPGLVLASGGLSAMTWGFPLNTRGKSGQPLKPKPINNARTDKLETGFWRASVETRRCLIPLCAFAEAEGPKGAKTRTWFTLPEEPIFTAAGVWRVSAEWGRVFAMVMTEACIR